MRSQPLPTLDFAVVMTPTGKRRGAANWQEGAARASGIRTGASLSSVHRGLLHRTKPLLPGCRHQASGWAAAPPALPVALGVRPPHVCHPSALGAARADPQLPCPGKGPKEAARTFHSEGIKINLFGARANSREKQMR